MKLLGNLFLDNKIIMSATVEVDEYQMTFFQMTKTVCESLKCMTPILVRKHVLDFKKFNHCTFKQDDFVDNVSFDKFVMQNITGK